MKKMALLLTMALCLVLLGLFQRFFDQSPLIASAKSLVGQSKKSVVSVLGPPDSIYRAEDYETHRSEWQTSFNRVTLPPAKGMVYVYNRMPTVIFIYEENETVVRVVVGQS